MLLDLVRQQQQSSLCIHVYSQTQEYDHLSVCVCRHQNEMRADYVEMHARKSVKKV